MEKGPSWRARTVGGRSGTGLASGGVLRHATRPFHGGKPPGSSGSLTAGPMKAVRSGFLLPRKLVFEDTARLLTLGAP